MSAETEADMLAAILAHVQDENYTDHLTRLKGVKLTVVTDNGDLPCGERLVYVTADSFNSYIILDASDAPMGTAAAPQLRNRHAL